MMRLVKSHDGDKYVLTFEITGAEAAAGDVDMHKLWQSSKLTDYIDALDKMTKPKTHNPFANFFGRTRPFNTNDPFAGKHPPFPGDRDPGMGSFTREELNEYIRRHQPGYSRAWQGFNSTTQAAPEPSWAKTLGVKSSATKDEIKARYRTLAKENHPDRGGDPAKFAKITEAYNEAMAR